MNMKSFRNPKYLERYEDVVFDLEQTFINNANINNQLENAFLFNTFSVSTDPRTLNRCYLEVGNGNEYPDIHYKPTKDATRVFRDVMSYVYANNDYQLPITTMNYQDKQRQVILFLELFLVNKKQKLKKKVENFC